MPNEPCGDSVKIYVASSWRNPIQQDVVAALRKAGHEVYDFRNPAPGNHGFRWSDIDPDWQNWGGEGFTAALKHPIAEAGFALDKEALDWCEACVLVLPSGKSAHLEAGYTIGQGKPTAVLLAERMEPELMYKLADTPLLTVEAVVEWANSLRGRVVADRDSLRAQLAEEKAGAAGMRGMLERVWIGLEHLCAQCEHDVESDNWTNCSGDDDCEVKLLRKALYPILSSPTLGADMLKRQREAERLLTEARDGILACGTCDPEYCTAYKSGNCNPRELYADIDAFLKGGEQRG